MGSRYLIGAGAWLLGAASATAGSLYAIAQLGQGLVEQHTARYSVAMVNAELALDGAPRTTDPATSRSPSASPKVSHSSATRRSGRKHHATPAVRYSSKWLTSNGGMAYVACGPSGVQLLHDIPAQGFEVKPFVRGPSPVVSVTFINSSIGWVINVRCDSAGVPVAQVHDYQRGWSPHHDE